MTEAETESFANAVNAQDVSLTRKAFCAFGEYMTRNAKASLTSIWSPT